jgi:hypothetical protein
MFQSRKNFPGGELLPMVGVADALLHEKTRIPDREKFEHVLKDVEPLSDLNMFYTEYDPNAEVLEPFLIDQVPDDLMRSALIRIRDETSVNGPLRLVWSLQALMSGDEYARLNPYVRRIKAYLMDPRIGMDPIIEGTERGVVNIFSPLEALKPEDKQRPNPTSRDSMTATRLFVLMRGYQLSMQWQIPAEVLEELILKSFENPYMHATFLKGATNVYKHLLGAMSRDGLRLEWKIISDRGSQGSGIELANFNRVAMNGDTNDQVEFERIQDTLISSKRDMIEKGYPLLEEWLDSLIYAKSDAYHIGQMAFATFIESVSGFTRSNLKVGVEAVVANSTPFEGVPAYKEDLLDVLNEMLESIKNELPSPAELIMKLPGLLTTKSAGGHKVKFELELNGHKLSVDAKDKIMNAYASLSKLMDRDLMLAAHTYDNPGHIASRDVAVRLRRAVWMIMLEQFLAELPVGQAALHWMSSHPNFTVAKESAKTVANHSRGIHASGDPRSLIILRDYSSFDQTMLPGNVYKIVVEALLKKEEEWGLEDEYFGYANILAQLRAVMQKHIDGMWFTFADEEPFKVHFEASGEYWTITMNGIVNEADYRNWMKLLHKEAYVAGFHFTEGHHEITGDDFVCFFDVSPNITVEEVNLVVDTMVSSAESNGLKVNGTKTSVRRFFYEYLKKTAFNGWVLPRFLQINTLTSERPNFREPVFSRLSALYGITTEYISRGGDYPSAMMFATHAWNLMREAERFIAHGGAGKAHLKEKFDIPFIAAFMPRTLGGGGQLPWTMAGASKDATMFYHYDPIVLDAIARVAALLDVPSGNVRTQVAKQVMDSGQLSDGIEHIEQALHQDTERLNNQEAAVKALTQMGVKVDSFYHFRFSNSVQRSVRRAVHDDAAFQKLVLEEQNERVAKMMEKVAEYSPLEGPPLVYVTCIDDETRAWVQRFMKGDRYVSFIRREVYGEKTEDMIEEHTRPLGKLGVVIEPVGKSEIVIAVRRVGSNAPIVRNRATVEFESPRDFEERWESLFEGYARGETFESPAWREYKWQQMFDITQSFEVEEVLSVCPIAGLDPWIAKHVRQMGVSTMGDNEAIDIVKAIASLKRGRRALPNDIRPEMLIEVLGHPVIAASPSSIANVLMMMGVLPGPAMAFGNTAAKRLSSMTELNRYSAYSTTDQITGYMDLRNVTYSRVVEAGVIEDLAVTTVMKGLAMNYALTRPAWEPLRHTAIHVWPWRLVAGRNAAMGRFSVGTEYGWFDNFDMEF